MRPTVLALTMLFVVTGGTAAMADDVLLGGHVYGNSICLADSPTSLKPGDIRSIFTVQTNDKRRCVTANSQSELAIPLWAAIVQNYYIYNSNWNKLEEIKKQTTEVSTNTLSTDAKIDALAKEMRAQQTMLLTSLRGELIARLDSLPMELVKDRAAYEVLKARLQSDFEQVFAKLQ